MNKNSKKRQARILVKRAYEPSAPDDGYRLLVDALWPRGISKETLQLDLWLKSIAPSRELRQWYGHDPVKWPEFQKRYFAELSSNPEAVESLKSCLQREPVVTFIYSSKETELNNAIALKAYIQSSG